MLVLKIGGRAEPIQIIVLLWSARILKRILDREYVDTKNSFGVKYGIKKSLQKAEWINDIKNKLHGLKEGFKMKILLDSPNVLTKVPI